MSTTEFNSLLEANWSFLKPRALQLTRDTEAANDLCQETLYRALHYQDKYQEGSNLCAWLYTIMRNTFINTYRKNKRIRSLDEHESYLMKESVMIAEPVVNRGIAMKEIHKEVYKLPKILKSPFMLYLEGYKYQEIAQEMQEPLGTIKSRIFHARKQLRRKVEG